MNRVFSRAALMGVIILAGTLTPAGADDRTAFDGAGGHVPVSIDLNDRAAHP